jgi:hypothetical protein
MFNYSFSRRPAVTECPSADNTPLWNGTVASGSAPSEDVDVVGHKLSFINVKEELDKSTDGTPGPMKEGGDSLPFPLNHDSHGLFPKSETDELSIQMEDLSGSILDNLPSSDDNSVEPDICDNLTPSSPPTFVFHPIGQLLEHDVESDEEDLLLAPSLRRVAPKKETRVMSPPDLSSDVSSSAIVIALPSKLVTPIDQSLSVSAPKERAEVPRKLRWCLYLVVAMTFVMWLFTKLFLNKDNIENPVDGFWTRFVSSPIGEITVFTADMDLTPTSQYLSESTTVSPFTLLIHNNHPISSVEGDSLINEVDSGAVFNMLRPSFSSVDDSKTGSFLNMTYWSFSSFWFPEWIRKWVAAVCFVYETVHFIASAIYTLTLLSPGIVGFCMLLKFISFVSPTTTIGTKKHIRVKTESGKDTFATTDMSISVRSLCRFLRACQGELSRCGRRSRVAPPSDKFWQWNAYDKSAYEGLSIEDLKFIGDFLGLTGLNALSKHKINLIGAIIVQYEAILRKLTSSELKQILKVLKADPPDDSKHNDLLKIIVEAGF